MDERSWSAQRDAYCERLDFAFWAEPVNALTNASFLIAAIVAVIAARRAGRLDGGMAVLIALTTAIGIGSFLFHTFATRWAALADVAPIQLFIVAYLILTMRWLFGFGWVWSVAIGVLFVAIAIPGRRAIRALIGETLHGGSGYIPALVALVVVAVLLVHRRHPAAGSFVGTAALFFTSLGLRTLDTPLCPLLPLGTHFLWHLLNGILLGWLMLTMIRHGRPPGEKPRPTAP